MPGLLFRGDALGQKLQHPVDAVQIVLQSIQRVADKFIVRQIAVILIHQLVLYLGPKGIDHGLDLQLKADPLSLLQIKSVHPVNLKAILLDLRLRHAQPKKEVRQSGVIKQAVLCSQKEILPQPGIDLHLIRGETAFRHDPQYIGDAGQNRRGTLELLIKLPPDDLFFQAVPGFDAVLKGDHLVIFFLQHRRQQIDNLLGRRFIAVPIFIQEVGGFLNYPKKLQPVILRLRRCRFRQRLRLIWGLVNLASFHGYFSPFSFCVKLWLSAGTGPNLGFRLFIRAGKPSPVTRR